MLRMCGADALARRFDWFRFSRPKSKSKAAGEGARPTQSLECRAGAALYELTLSGAAEKLFAFNQNPAAREHNVRHASYFDALEHRIVHPHVMGLRADRVLPFGIENYQVGVAAYRDRAFAGIEAEEFGRSGGDQLDE